MNNGNYDVAVIGGGPAGSACATFLSQKGHKVILLEKEVFPRFMVGESLLPAIWELWTKLDVVDKIEAMNYPVKRGVLFHLEAEDKDYQFRTDQFPEYFDRPYTYHVDRASYDDIMLKNAREKGVDVNEGCLVNEVLFDGDRAVGVKYTDADGESHEERTSIVVDATGRRTMLARKLGRRYPNEALKKVSYYTHFKGAGRRTADDGSTMTDIHTTDGGWIWCIPLPNGISSLGVVLDAKYVQSQDGRPQDFLDRALAGNSTISNWLEESEQLLPIQKVPSISYLSDNFVGDGYVMIGDAAMFVDPVFSAGVTLATRGADIAAETISEAIRNGDTSEAALKPFEEKLRYPVGNMIKIIMNWYEILTEKSRGHIFEQSLHSPILRERLIVLLSGGYEKADLEGFL